MFDIELLMNDLKMTQSDLAAVLNVSQTAISKNKVKLRDWRVYSYIFSLDIFQAHGGL